MSSLPITTTRSAPIAASGIDPGMTVAMDRIRRGAAVAACLAAFGMAHQVLGVFEPIASRALAALLIAAACWVGGIPGQPKPSPWIWKSIGVAAAGAYLWNRDLGPLTLAVPIACLAAAGGNLTFFCMAGAALLLEILEASRLQGATLPIPWTGLSSLLSMGENVLDATPMAAPLILLSILFACAASAAGVAGPRRASVGIGLSLALTAVHVWAQMAWPFGRPGARFHGEIVWFLPLALGAMIALVFPGRPEPSPPPVFPDKWNRLACPILACLLLVAGGLWMTWPSMPEPQPGKVLLHTRGVVNIDPPVHGTYIPQFKHHINYSLLFRLLRSTGFDTGTLDGEITAAALRDCRIFMIVIPSQPFSVAERQVLTDFVGRGGSLLIVGEHTNIEGLADHSNALLDPFSIQINDDTAETWRFGSDWTQQFEWIRHPATWSVRGIEDLQFGTGASLFLGWRAWPLIIARGGFSDASNKENVKEQFLGNRRPDRGEKMGDVIVAAESAYGDGKVVVLGDTLPFQDMQIQHSWRFCFGLFDYLRGKGSPGPVWPGALVALAGAVLLILVRNPAWLVGGIGGLAAILALAQFRGTLLSEERIAGVRFDTPLALIDLSHRPMFTPRPSDLSNETGGFCLNLARNGFLPLGVKSEDLLDQAQVVVLPASARPYRMTARLEEFMRRGGIVLVSVGGPEKGCAEDLARWAGLRVVHETAPGRAFPLGRFTKVRTFDPAIAPRFDCAWPIVETRPGLIPLANAEGFPAVVLRPCGAGGMLWISDSVFFMNANLESHEEYSEANVRFLRRLFDLLRSRKWPG